MPVPYFHVVYTLPGKLRDIAYQNKRVVYDLLMKAAAETTLAIAANPRRLGADPPAADPQRPPDITPDAPRALRCPCPRCGARMIVIEVFARGCEPRWRPTPTANDTS